MIGYTCAYLRYYYPAEFIAAYLNNAKNEDDIQAGTELAKVKKITINPIKFRHSNAIYSVDPDDNKAIFKGVASIKYLNAEVANRLYDMRDQEFNSFIDVLNVFPGDTRQRDILISLGYFAEFGKTHKLIKMCRVYEEYHGRKQLKIEDISKELYERLKPYSYKETPKQIYFNIEDMDRFIADVCRDIPDTDIPIQTRLKRELEYLGYCSLTIPEAKNTAAIMKVDTKYSPRITLYNLWNGSTRVCKLSKSAFADRPLNEGDIIEYGLTTKPRYMKNGDGDWVVVSGQTDYWINTYAITHQYD